MTPPRILVVEDEQDIAALIKHTLERSLDAFVEIVVSRRRGAARDRRSSRPISSSSI